MEILSVIFHASRYSRRPQDLQGSCLCRFCAWRFVRLHSLVESTIYNRSLWVKDIKMCSWNINLLELIMPSMCNKDAGTFLVNFQLFLLHSWFYLEFYLSDSCVKSWRIKGLGVRQKSFWRASLFIFFISNFIILVDYVPFSSWEIALLFKKHKSSYNLSLCWLAE